MSNHFPFPITKETINKDDAPSSFYFTFPLDTIMSPSPNHLCDIKGNNKNARDHLILFVCLLHMVNRTFYGANPLITNCEDDDKPRVRVFMEYLAPKECDDQLIQSLQLNDCLGIRFHFILNDSSLSLSHAMQCMIQGNNPDLNLCSEGSKKKRANNLDDKKRRAKLEYAWENVMNVCIDWYGLCNNYIGWTVLRGKYTSRELTDVDQEFMPRKDHPLDFDKVFSWKQSFVDGMHNDLKSKGDSFAFPELVYEVPDQMLTNTSALLKCILPRAPMWFKQSTPSDVSNTLNTLNCKEYMDRYVIQREMTTNDLRDLYEIQKEKEQAQDFQLSNAQRAVGIRRLEKIWTPDASVSEPIQLLSKFIRGLDTWTTAPLEQFDSDGKLSPFGNMVAEDFFFFENELRISTTHSILYRVMINVLDAYRNKKDLHNNILLLGQGATGKSHILDTIQDLFVPGTVTKVSHSTAKAHAVEGNNNDHISFYHEMPPSMMGKDGSSGAETGDHILKDMLTSGEVITVQPHIDNDLGTRTKLTFKNEMIGTVSACTNERADVIPEALGTRMIKICVNDQARPGFSINEMTSGVMGNASIDKKKLALHTKRWRIRQALVNAVEKMIYTKCLDDVNMSVFNYMQVKMTNYMKEKGYMYMKDNIRDIKFL